MSFQTDEAKIEQPASAELYEFTCRSFLYRYTSFASDILHEGHLYKSAPISRTTIQRNLSVLDVPSITVTIPIELVGVHNELYGHSGEFFLSIVRKHISTGQSRDIFIGTVRTYSKNERSLKLECFDIKGKLLNNVATIAYTPFCNNSLYDSICTIQQELYTLSITGVSFTINTTVDYGVSIRAGKIPRDINNPGDQADMTKWIYYSIGPSTSPACIIKYLDLTALPADNRKLSEIGTEVINGIITHLRTGRQYSIVGHDGTLQELSIFPLIDAFVPGDVFTLSMGCNKSRLICESYFNNIVNFVGFPFVPTDNLTESIG